MASTSSRSPQRDASANAGKAPRTPSPQDRRIERRVTYQTVAATIISQETGASIDIKCWTRDLSPSGARIMTPTPIDGDTVMLRLPLPKLGTRLIEAQIVSRTTETQCDFHNRNSTTMHLYGVRFTKVLANDASRG